MTTRVVYWNNIPAPYMVERFNAVARRGNLDFEAWFNVRVGLHRSWAVEESTWEFSYRYLPSVGVGARRLSLPSPLLGHDLPDLLVSLYAEPSFLLGWVIARRRGVKTAFWCEVTFDRWVERRPWKEFAKRRLLPSADAILTAGGDGRSYALRYGVDPERVFILPHAIDVDHFASGCERNGGSRETVRRSLGLRGTTFIYVGRLWRGKGLDYLVDAFAGLEQRLVGGVSLLLVGDGVDEAHYRRLCEERGLSNVAFAGFVQKDGLPELYAAADAFVFPTLGDPWGLVVDEAAASRLPVISTSAAGEISDRIADGVNGFIVPPADSTALLQAMETFATSPELRTRMGEEAARRIVGHTPERWAQEFEQAVDLILSLPSPGSKGTVGARGRAASA
jgi:glycosyltransferase involved in cell wall biosynthesis